MPLSYQAILPSVINDFHFCTSKNVFDVKKLHMRITSAHVRAAANPDAVRKTRTPRSSPLGAKFFKTNRITRAGS